MSTRIKSNLNGSPNGCNLAAFKEHINTCFKRWQQEIFITKSQEEYKSQRNHYPFPNQDEECHCKLKHNTTKRFFKDICKKCSFVQRAIKVLKSISPQKRFYKNKNCTTLHDSEGPLQYGRKVEIVAKLLSSTLISKAESPITEEKNECFEKELKVIQSTHSTSTSDFFEEKMTITDLTFMELREEFPDLNAEIRSILTARAQEGATIPEIRDDYRKLTGLIFPVYQDVTEFLLTIPHVTAYCTETGTRKFNIMPIDKTKHIYDMVLHQKIPAEPVQRPTTHNYYRERERNDNYQPTNWRQSAHRKFLQNNTNYVAATKTAQQEQLMPPAENNMSRNISQGFYENNCFYQDNCNYLYNRICNQNQQEPLNINLIEKDSHIFVKPVTIPPSNTCITPALNNFDADAPTYKNNLNHLNNLFQIQEKQQENCQYQHTLNNNLKNVETRRSFYTPYKPGINPISSRSSSPAAKSSYTNESAYTDSDYEAHLLDFLLMGDDFFLYMARMELRCKFKKNQRVLQSGLCVSGQTIGASIRRIKSLCNQRRSIILNIGSVDIMQGRQLIQIEHDYRDLLVTMLKNGIKPILTTLAPLGNYSHKYEVKRMLERFNDFIKREGQKRNLIVIDIWKCLVNEKSQVLFDCYQNEPRNVTGTPESYLFWNKIGRQRVLQLIESKLEY